METIDNRTSAKVLKLHYNDNTLVVLQDVKKGEKIYHGNDQFTMLQDIPSKHKFVTCDLEPGAKIIMYGLVVGKALHLIQQGEAITVQNTLHEVTPFQVRPTNFQWTPLDVTDWKIKTFQGYHRTDGQVGTRNYWIVFPLVFCENRNVEYIKGVFEKKLGYSTADKYDSFVDNLIDLYQNDRLHNTEIRFSDLQGKKNKRVFENIDGIKFLTHEGGCGGTQDDAANLCKLFAGYINNPNVAGATVLGLGCQKAEVDMLKQSLNEVNPALDKPVLYFEQQEFPSEENLLQQAIFETFKCLTEVNKVNREPAGLDKLVLGLKCGGSDGFSGITANPAMGHVSDILASIGGKAILAEFPELCGAEQDLIDRCVNTGIATKFARLMTDYNNKAMAIGSSFSMNPSPGNIKDGLITDAIKSAGAAQKGGKSPVQDVLNYTEYVKKAGLNLLCTPGNDVEATTGMAGSGANLIIFSTGLGTPTGNAITPVIKTSTNSLLPRRMQDIIDFDHGDIITEGKSIEQSGEELLIEILQIASGEKLCKAEQLRQDDFIPWKKGVSL